MLEWTTIPVTWLNKVSSLLCFKSQLFVFQLHMGVNSLSQSAFNDRPSPAPVPTGSRHCEGQRFILWMLRKCRHWGRPSSPTHPRDPPMIIRHITMLINLVLWSQDWYYDHRTCRLMIIHVLWSEDSSNDHRTWPGMVWRVLVSYDLSDDRRTSPLITGHVLWS